MSKSGTQADKTLRLLAVCGILGPILYTIVLIIVGLLRPSYNHVTQYMSELGEVGGPHAIIMNIAGFFMLGLLMIAFASGLHRGISERRGSKLGPALIAVAGAGAALIAIFPVNPSSVNPPLTGMMHGVSAMTLGVGMTLAPFAIANRLKHDQRWKGYRSYSLATGVVTAVAGFIFFSIHPEGWMGLLQRVALGVPLLWMEVMAIRLLRLV